MGDRRPPRSPRDGRVVLPSVAPLSSPRRLYDDAFGRGVGEGTGSPRSGDKTLQQPPQRDGRSPRGATDILRLQSPTSPGSGLLPSVLRHWQDSLEADRGQFHSTALRSELELNRVIAETAGQEQPNQIRTAVAFQLFSDLCSSSLDRFGSVMEQLREQLRVAIFAVEGGDGGEPGGQGADHGEEPRLQPAMVPYFVKYARWKAEAIRLHREHRALARAHAQSTEAAAQRRDTVVALIRRWERALVAMSFAAWRVFVRRRSENRDRIARYVGGLSRARGLALFQVWKEEAADLRRERNKRAAADHEAAALAATARGAAEAADPDLVAHLRAKISTLEARAAQMAAAQQDAARDAAAATEALERERAAFGQLCENLRRHQAARQRMAPAPASPSLPGPDPPAASTAPETIRRLVAWVNAVLPPEVGRNITNLGSDFTDGIVLGELLLALQPAGDATEDLARVLRGAAAGDLPGDGTAGAGDDVVLRPRDDPSIVCEAACKALGRAGLNSGPLASPAHIMTGDSRVIVAVLSRLMALGGVGDPEVGQRLLVARAASNSNSAVQCPKTDDDSPAEHAGGEGSEARGAGAGTAPEHSNVRVAAAEGALQRGDVYLLVSEALERESAAADAYRLNRDAALLGLDGVLELNSGASPRRTAEEDDELHQFAAVEGRRIDDLLKDDPAAPETVSSLQSLLREHATGLKMVFNHYSASGPDGRSSTMDLAEYMSMVKDSNMLCKSKKGRLTSVDCDLVFRRVNWTSSSGPASEGSNPDRELVPREYVEALVRLAARKYASDPSVRGLAAQTQKLIVEHVSRATVSCPDEFRRLVAETEVREVLKKYRPQLGRIFQYYADGASGRVASSKKNGSDRTICHEEFVMLAKDANIVDALLPQARLAGIFSGAQHSSPAPGAASSRQPAAEPEVDPDSEMVFSEFAEAVAACAVYRFPDPYTPFVRRLEMFIRDQLVPPLLAIANSGPRH